MSGNVYSVASVNFEQAGVPSSSSEQSVLPTKKSSSSSSAQSQIFKVSSLQFCSLINNWSKIPNSKI